MTETKTKKFNLLQYVYTEVYGYFEEYIEFLEDEELEALGDYPLINKDSWELELFDDEKYEDATLYITLFEYSENLYYFYMERYNEAMGIDNYRCSQVERRKNDNCRTNQKQRRFEKS